MNKVKSIIKDWALIFSMLAGIFGFLLLDAMHLPAEVRGMLLESTHILQPILIFTMLFLTFCKISFAELRLTGWHLWLILFQGGLFLGIAFLLMSMPQSGLRVILEGAMLCLICPTATAGAVITRKLGGNAASITTYTIIINLLTALLVPAMVPLVHPAAGVGFVESGIKIMSKVFPLLLLPLITALVLRRFAPKVRERLAMKSEWSFYLWIVALALALAVTTHSVVRSNVDLWTQLGLVVVSLVCCVGQFAFGRRMGCKYGDAVTAGQSLGQKNTVLAIWMGYTFFTPITALVGGFYSIWHNIINSAQLYRHEHPHHDHAQRRGNPEIREEGPQAR